MTDRSKFVYVVNRNNKKLHEVATAMGISPQALSYKLGNVYPFRANEMKIFNDMFPDVTPEEFQAIFFADELAASSNA